MKISKAMIGNTAYTSIYNQAVDSLKTWEKAKLKGYEFAWAFNYRLDSTLCFNVKKDRLITALLIQCDRSTCTLDNINFFYGAKIKGKWYFFDGASIVLLREYYQKDIHTPLSFEKLHEIAMKEVFSSYLIKNKQGTWEINDKFFKGMESKNRGEGYGSCFTCKTFEESVLYLIHRNWQHRDTTNYAPGD